MFLVKYILILSLVSGIAYSQDAQHVTLRETVTLREYIEAKIEALDTKTSERYPSKSEYLSDLAKIQESIRTLQEYKSLMDGKASQSNVNTSLFISSASLLISLLSMFGFGKRKREG